MSRLERISKTKELLKGKTVAEITRIRVKYGGADKECLSYNTFGFYIDRRTIDEALLDAMLFDEIVIDE